MSLNPAEDCDRGRRYGPTLGGYGGGYGWSPSGGGLGFPPLSSDGLSRPSWTSPGCGWDAQKLFPPSMPAMPLRPYESVGKTVATAERGGVTLTWEEDECDPAQTPWQPEQRPQPDQWRQPPQRPWQPQRVNDRSWGRFDCSPWQPPARGQINWPTGVSAQWPQQPPSQLQSAKDRSWGRFDRSSARGQINWPTGVSDGREGHFYRPDRGFGRSGADSNLLRPPDQQGIGSPNINEPKTSVRRRAEPSTGLLATPSQVSTLSPPPNSAQFLLRQYLLSHHYASSITIDEVMSSLFDQGIRSASDLKKKAYRYSPEMGERGRWQRTGRAKNNGIAHYLASITAANPAMTARLDDLTKSTKEQRAFEKKLVAAGLISASHVKELSDILCNEYRVSSMVNLQRQARVRHGDLAKGLQVSRFLGEVLHQARAHREGVSNDFYDHFSMPESAMRGGRGYQEPTGAEAELRRHLLRHGLVSSRDVDQVLFVLKDKGIRSSAEFRREAYRYAPEMQKLGHFEDPQRAAAGNRLAAYFIGLSMPNIQKADVIESKESKQFEQEIMKAGLVHRSSLKDLVAGLAALHEVKNMRALQEFADDRFASIQSTRQRLQLAAADVLARYQASLIA